MGFKQFQNNTTLTAEDMNDYLAEQAVLVFDDVSQRNAQLTTPQEGMVTYIKSLRKFLAWTSSGWAEVHVGVKPFVKVGLVSGNAALGAGDTRVTAWASTPITQTHTGLWDAAGQRLVLNATGLWRLHLYVALSGGTVGGFVVARLTSAADINTSFASDLKPVTTTNETHLHVVAEASLASGSAVHAFLYATHSMSVRTSAFGGPTYMQADYLGPAT
jgi:hypothetical protein